ncbi:hypothetical protein JW979_07280, partial [bacterium]|nr:hypothetical protein [candidate division CSSED10-310 bacterium]
SYKKYIEKKPFDAPVLYKMALAFEALGDTSRMNHFMHQFLDLWNDADTDLYEVKDALRYVHNRENDQ